jgi:hypothetical protein
VLTYFIADEPEGPLTIEITDSSGELVRTYSSEETDFERCVLGNMDQRIAYELKYPDAKKGLNQWTWDMRANGLHCIDDIKLFAGFGGATVSPGQYTVRVSVDSHESVANVMLASDPRKEASPADYEFLASKLDEVTSLLNELLDRLDDVRTARSQVEALRAQYADAAGLQSVAQSAIERLTAWENEVTQTQYGTYEDEDSMPPMLDVHIRHVLDVIDGAGAPVSAGSLQRLDDLKLQWQAQSRELRDISNSDIAAINAWARNNGVLHVSPPAR